MKKWQLPINFILAFVLLIGLIGLEIQPKTDDLGRLHPALIQIAAGPERKVPVIVQKTNATGRVEDLVSELGGTVTKDLHIINAFAAELPTSALLELAGSDGVRWVIPDAPVISSNREGDDDGPCGDDLEDCPQNHYLDTLGVRQVWDMGLDGQGIAVAVIDSGISTDKDFNKRLVARKNFYSNRRNVNDTFGHGTHVAGIIGGSGADSDGLYAGIAPGVNLISLKIGNNSGMAHESDAVEAMQWVLEHKDRYNIRVVNLSINSTVELSYHASPLGAAAEILWFNRVVVVASAGNTDQNGGFSTIDAAPASDPFIITVGASNENGDTNPANDTVATFSASGTTADGFAKPDIIAPGQDIVSVLSGRSDWGEEYPDRVVLDGQYFRLSGTSMSAPMVTGAVALLLQDEPNLTPDQVKYRLVNASNSVDGQPYLDVYAAVTAGTTESLNTGIAASQLLWTGDQPVNWDSVNWNSVNWNSVNWNSVNWNSVNWNSVNWNSVSWDD